MTIFFCQRVVLHGFDYSSPKHAGGYFAEFVPKGCTGILSPIAQQAKNSLASLIVSANRGLSSVYAYTYLATHAYIHTYVYAYKI